MAIGWRRASTCGFVAVIIGVAGCGGSTTGVQSGVSRPAPVNSVYQRLVARSPETAGHVANAARDGATADTLADQARLALSQVPMPRLVLIQTIDNDIHCDGSDSAHISAFGASVAEALDVITKASPKSVILIVSQPGRPVRVAATVAKVPEAKAAFTGSGMCDLFDSDGNTNAQHIATVTALGAAYEAEQDRICGLVPQCNGDRGAFASYVDDVNDLAQGDWNHLAVHGHARLAAAIWPTVAQLLRLGSHLDPEHVSPSIGSSRTRSLWPHGAGKTTD